MKKKVFSFILFFSLCLLLSKPCYAMPDESFVANMATEIGARVKPQFVTSDGKILVIGQFGVVDGVFRDGIARLNPDGSIDPTFSVDVGNFLFSQHSTNKIYFAAEQSDGKILLVGSFSQVNGATSPNFARLNQDGSLDTSFSSNLGQNNFERINSILPLSDGKILISGYYMQVNGVSRFLIRLNSDGTLDNTFNNSAIDSQAGKIVVQPDGKILVVTFNSSSSSRRLTKLSANGVIDTSFNPIVNGSITDIAIQPDQKIILSGNFDRVNNINRQRIARINTDGTLDETLNATPAMNCCRSSVVNRVLLQSDGKILIGGVFDKINGVSRSDIARLNSDGTLDNTFEANVRSTSLYGDSYDINALLKSPDGQVIIGGYFSRIENSFRSSIAKLEINGSLNNTFDPVIGMRSETQLVKAQADGKILIGGSFTIVNGKRIRFIIRLNQDSSIDETFTPNRDVIEGVTAIELQPDNKILLGGFFVGENGNSPTAFSRLNPDGSFDTTFKSVVDGRVSTIYYQADNKILIGGDFHSINDTLRRYLARLHPDGSLDTSLAPVNFFDGSGTVINKIIAQSDNKILVAGRYQTVNSVTKIGVARINTNGSLDTTFSTDLTPSSPTDVFVYDMSLLPDGKILAAGTLGTTNGNIRGVAKFNSDGTNDLSFNPSNIVPHIFPRKLLIQDDGRILVGSDINSLHTTKGLIRLNSDGSFDNSLNIGSGTDYGVYSLDKISNNKIIVVGNFTEFNGMRRWGVARLSLSGPTASSVSITGRVMNGKRGIGNAVVQITSQTGEIRSVRSNPFGYYRFKDVQAGETYVFNVFAKSFSFSPQMVVVNQEMSELNFIAEP